MMIAFFFFLFTNYHPDEIHSFIEPNLIMVIK